ncbi:hypothetical protein NC796_02235 [Aliifodinibius sp. S!AR15-10]|uniref:hypothetical protein n=1 Tax=Aliifodinibius sp. S!AR15-10 TaxID=2950437 RepID=UPI00285BBEEA|nr:hypothetical protein [Aliifodinibius sp. S!AR15-10]MDR8389939.1 hypothetical protein [Aliifodinibius sp. S!AR15-10]
MTFEELKPFKRDLKKLSKRYRTLRDDLEILKKVLRVSPEARPPFSFEIGGLGIESCVIKVKKMACRSLPGRGANTGLRVVYAHFEGDEKIVFVELYFKGEKQNEDRNRILEHFN